MAEEINTNLDTTPLPPNNLVAQDPQSAELAGYVRTKTFGRDVRESIARSIELNSTRSKSAETLANETLAVTETATRNMASQVELIKAEKDAVIANATVDSEVILARGGKATLGQRLDETDEQLTQIVKYVSEFGAIGDGMTDDTEALNNAVEYISGKNTILKLEKGKTYMVSLDGWEMQSNSTIDFNGAKIKLLPNDLYLLGDRNQPLNIEGVENVTIYNPIVEGDRLEHIKSPAYKPENVDGYGGEWGMGISIYSSKNINIYNARISNCWGDGICLSGLGNENVNLYGKTIITNCRRQGISFINVDGFYGEHIEVTDIYGTQPMAGLDFEPDQEGYKTINVVIDYLKTENVDEPVLFVQFSAGIEAKINQITAINSRRFFEFHANALVDNPGYIQINNIYANVVNNRSLFLAKNWALGQTPRVKIGNVHVDEWKGQEMQSDYLSSYLYGYINDDVPHFNEFGGFDVDRIHVDKGNFAYTFRDFYFRNISSETEPLKNSVVFKNMEFGISKNTPFNGKSNGHATHGIIDKTISFKKEFPITSINYTTSLETIEPKLGTKIPLDVENISSDFSRSLDGDVQILIDGVYIVEAHIRYYSSSYGARTLSISKGNYVLSDIRKNASNTGFTSISTVKILHLSKGDRINIRTRQESEGILKIYTGQNVTGIQLTKIG